MARSYVEHQTRFDVGIPAGVGEACTIAASVFAPIESPSGAIAVLVPGGSYTRAYYDLKVAGGSGYSAAEQLAARGVVAVAIDNLGTGESTRPRDGRDATLAALAQALALVAWQTRTGAQRGELHPQLAPIAAPLLFGVGHSLGGAITMVAQAELAPFSGVAILGMTTGVIKHGREDSGGASWTPERDAQPGYIHVPRQQLRSWFHADDVPPEVLAADELTQTVLPEGALAISGAQAELKHAASRISAPVLLAFGDIDVSHDPMGEPAAYSNSADVRLLMLPGAAHCHNMASSRAVLWTGVNDWIAGLAG